MLSKIKEQSINMQYVILTNDFITMLSLLSIGWPCKTNCFLMKEQEKSLYPIPIALFCQEKITWITWLNSSWVNLLSLRSGRLQKI